MALNNAKDLHTLKKFDVDLQFGQEFEGLIDNIFSGADTAEIKTERGQWVKYGNIAIELECSGKPSGLTSTEASWWIHNLSYKGELMGSFILPVDVLRKVTDAMIEDKVARVTKGGDGYRSKLALLPITRIMDYVQKECE